MLHTRPGDASTRDPVHRSSDSGAGSSALGMRLRGRDIVTLPACSRRRAHRSPAFTIFMQDAQGGAGGGGNPPKDSPHEKRRDL